MLYDYILRASPFTTPKPAVTSPARWCRAM